MPSDEFGFTRPWMLNALKASMLNRSLTFSVMVKILYNEIPFTASYKLRQILPYRISRLCPVTASRRLETSSCRTNLLGRENIFQREGSWTCFPPHNLRVSVETQLLHSEIPLENVSHRSGVCSKRRDPETPAWDRGTPQLKHSPWPRTGLETALTP